MSAPVPSVAASHGLLLLLLHRRAGQAGAALSPCPARPRQPRRRRQQQLLVPPGQGASAQKGAGLGKEGPLEGSPTAEPAHAPGCRNGPPPSSPAQPFSLGLPEQRVRGQVPAPRRIREPGRVRHAPCCIPRAGSERDASGPTLRPPSPPPSKARPGLPGAPRRERRGRRARGGRPRSPSRRRSRGAGPGGGPAVAGRVASAGRQRPVAEGEESRRPPSPGSLESLPGGAGLVRGSGASATGAAARGRRATRGAAGLRECPASPAPPRRPRPSRPGRPLGRGRGFRRRGPAWRGGRFRRGVPGGRRRSGQVLQEPERPGEKKLPEPRMAGKARGGAPAKLSLTPTPPERRCSSLLEVTLCPPAEPRPARPRTAQSALDSLPPSWGGTPPSLSPAPVLTQRGGVGLPPLGPKRVNRPPPRTRLPTGARVCAG